MGGRITRKPRQPATRLPASLRAAWGLGQAPTRGPKPALSLQRIVAAAVGVAAADGIGAVAMNRVAGELGVGTMSLYRYVEDKNALLALMNDAVFDSPPAPARAGETWREGLARWAHAHLAVLRRHPWLLRIPITGPPVMPNQVVWFERGLASLAGTRLSEAEKLYVMLLVNGFVRNEALLTADVQAATTAAGLTEEQAASSYGQLLSGLLDPLRFPALARLIASGVFDAPPKPDADFEFGLERILDGIAVLVDRLARRRRR